jgi:hypothetical protein
VTVSVLSRAVASYRDLVGMRVGFELRQRGAAFGPALTALLRVSSTLRRPGATTVSPRPRACREPLAAEAVAR